MEFRERPKKLEIEQEQIIEDKQLYEKAEIEETKEFLTKLTADDIVNLIIKFAVLLSGFNFYDYQEEFAKRIIYSLVTDDGETITGLFARQSGKSFTTARVIPSCAIMLPLLAELMKKYEVETKLAKNLSKFYNGLWVGVYAPSYDRAAIIGSRVNETLSSKRAREILSDPEIGMKFPTQLSSYINYLPRGSKIKVKSANKRVSIEGDTYHLLVTDETQEIDGYIIKKSMSPFLASTNGTTVHIGSSYPKRCYFYDIIQINKRADLNKPKKLKCHFEYDYTVAIKANPNYKKYIEKEKIKLGEFSEEFKMSYELYWPLSQGMLVTEDFLITHLGRDYGVTNADKFNDHVIAIDIAKVTDSTVVTVIEPDWENPIVIDPVANIVRYLKKIKNWYEIKNENYEYQFYALDEFINNYKWITLIIDATGVGSPIFDRFYARYGNDPTKNVIPFIFNNHTKSEAYILLARELAAERIIFPNSKSAQQLRKQRAFIYQLSSMAKEMRGSLFTVTAIDEKGNDDYPDSLAMCVWAIEMENKNNSVEEYYDTNIYKLNNTIYDRKSEIMPVNTFDKNQLLRG